MNNKYNKVWATALTLSLLTPVFAIPVQTEAAAYSKQFKDVSTNHSYNEIIHKMAQVGIINGYEDGTFRPNEKITRKHAAALLARERKLPKVKAFVKPKDLSTSNSYYGNIKALIEAGILETDSKGNINPNKELTRGEMAKALTIAYDLDTAGGNPLKDVSSKNKQYVTALYNNKITTGYEDKTFRENEGLTRAHYAVFMYRSMTLDKDVQDQLGRYEIYEQSYIGNYQIGKVPVPTKYKGLTSREFYNEQTAKYDKLKALVPKGGYASKSGASNGEIYTGTLKKLSDITGSKESEIAGYIDESAKTGEITTFVGGNNKKYFVIFQYTTNAILVGEDHRK